jgi:hypothetical protein
MFGSLTDYLLRVNKFFRKINKSQYFFSLHYSGASSQCSLVDGPSLSYPQFQNGAQVGSVLPAGTSQVNAPTQARFRPPVRAQVFIVFTNPKNSGANQAGFLLNSVHLLNSADPNSGNMC